MGPTKWPKAKPTPHFSVVLIPPDFDFYLLGSPEEAAAFPFHHHLLRERNVEEGKAKGWRGAGKWRRWLRWIQTAQEKPQKICRWWRRHRFHHHLRCTLCPLFFSFIYASSLPPFSLHWVCLQISKNRRVSVRTWQGKAVVDIREFYMKDGKQMPGKKGGFFTCLSIYGCIFQGH